MDQKLDLLPEVKSQLQGVDRGLENVEDTVDSLKREIRVASNNVASMIPWVTRARSKVARINLTLRDLVDVDVADGQYTWGP